jgi:hypothetical protein
VRAFAGEPQPREGPDDEVEELPERAPAVRRGHRGQLSPQPGLWEWAECRHGARAPRRDWRDRGLQGL